jgi:hypothetical protein
MCGSVGGKGECEERGSGGNQSEAQKIQRGEFIGIR